LGALKGIAQIAGTATSGSATTMVDAGLTLGVDAFAGGGVVIIHRGGVLLRAESIISNTPTTLTFATGAAPQAGDTYSIGSQAGVAGVLTTTTISSLRTTTISNNEIYYVKAHTTAGDGGGGNFRGVTGAAIGTYVDNNGTIIVPTGGDGSAAWLRVITGYATPRMFGARGNGVVDDTIAIQKALDSVSIGSTLLFTDGAYKITSTLMLTRNVSIKGTGNRSVVIRGDSLPANSPLLDIAITDNGGFLDVRNWALEDITMFQNLGGNHCVQIAGGFALITSAIRNCNFNASTVNNGKSLNVLNTQWTHSIFELNTCGSPLYLACGDANVFNKNMMLHGSGGPAFVIDIVNGVRNNTIMDNTIVSRDGALHVVNGSEIRFLNNQVEQFQTYGVNQSVPSASVYIEGSLRRSTNCVIENNNFGGGTNVDYSVYFANAEHCVVTKNHFVSVNTAEVFCGPLTKYIRWEMDNTVVSTISNPRTSKLFKAVIRNQSWANINMPLSLTGVNGWICPKFIKDSGGRIRFLGNFNGGTIIPGTLITTLPQPDVWGISTITRIPCVDSTGAVGSLKVVGTNGQIIVQSLSSNGGISTDGYQSFTDSNSF